MKYIYKGVSIFGDTDYVTPVEEVCCRDVEGFCKLLQEYGWKLIYKGEQLVFKGEGNDILVFCTIEEG